MRVYTDKEKALIQENERLMVLLKASYDVLRICHDSYYVEDALSVVVKYDGVECDGLCLMNDIGDIVL